MNDNSLSNTPIPVNADPPAAEATPAEASPPKIDYGVLRETLADTRKRLAKTRTAVDWIMTGIGEARADACNADEPDMTSALDAILHALDDIDTAIEGADDTFNQAIDVLDALADIAAAEDAVSEARERLAELRSGNADD